MLCIKLKSFEVLIRLILRLYGTNGEPFLYVKILLQSNLSVAWDIKIIMREGNGNSYLAYYQCISH